MPELPEVEIMTRHGHRWLAGSVVRSVAAPDLDVFSAGADLIDAIVGNRIDRVWRRAKHLLIDCGPYGLALHFRMTGKLVELPAEGRVRFVIETDRTSVGFKDTRRLGSVGVFPLAERDAWLSSLSLGPDAYPEVRPGVWWKDAFAGSRSAIKPALLDQRRVAGIGNILASELCFRIGLAPTTLIPAVPDAAWDALSRLAPTFIGEVIAAETAAEIRYVGEPGAAEVALFEVYGRESEPCSVCGTAVERLKQAQRSTFWCPTCQPVIS